MNNLIDFQNYKNFCKCFGLKPSYLENISKYLEFENKAKKCLEFVVNNLIR